MSTCTIRRQTIEALLILNNNNVKNCRVIVSAIEPDLKTRIIAYLADDMVEEAFDTLVKEAPVIQYLPAAMPAPRRTCLLTLDEALIKTQSKQVAEAFKLPGS